jgi:endonuclease/exonuclease/phosphatase family metal-dependent hydrolase
MTRLLALALVAACAHGALACVPFRQKERSVRVLVFNIHAGKDAGGRDNIADVAQLVRSTAADIVLLQEVDRGTKRSGGVDQLQALIDATEHRGVFGRTLDYDGGQYGIAALSDDGFAVNEILPLPVTPVQARAGGSPEPRGVLVTIALTALGRWQALTTHLDASAGDEYRLQEVEQLLWLLKRRLVWEDPLVLGGDFNATPDSAAIKNLLGFGLRDAWMECGEGDGFTFPADKPIKRIDYLFLTGTLRCTSARVLDTTISDHRPLLVTIEAP